MPDIESELQHLRDEIVRLSGQMIRFEVELASLTKSFDRHEQRQNESNQRVPVLLLGVISAGITAIGVMINAWMVKGP